MLSLLDVTMKEFGFLELGEVSIQQHWVIVLIRVNLNEVCLSLPSARQFRDEEECSFRPSFNWFLSAFTWDATYSVFEQKGFICPPIGNKIHDTDGGDRLRDDVAKAAAHADDQDEKYRKNKNSTKFNNIKCKINFDDIKPIILTQEQIEEEITAITDTMELNPCYPVSEVWNKLESIKSNTLNSLCLTKEEKKSIVDKISNIHNDIKSKRLLGEEYVFQEDYTDLLLSHNARVDPVIIFNQAQKLKMRILNSKSLTNKRKNTYILRINKIQDSLGLLSMQQNRYLDDSGFRSHGMRNFYNNYGFTPMATFTNRAYASLNNMLSINNIQYPQRQPYNIFDNIVSNACCHGFDGREDEPNRNIIKIELSTEGTDHIISISNNGKPVSEIVTEDYVFTYNSSTQNGKNHFGIGGYEVKRFMKEFDGDAEFISRPEDRFPVVYRLVFHNTNIQSIDIDFSTMV